ncbi:hypothetical protein ACFL2O_09755 [Thermodesulfobacteriota bacterium]
MENVTTEKTMMLATLIENASEGKKIELKASPKREVIRLKQDGQDVDSLVLSMEFSGKVDGKPFNFIKNYSFADDEVQFALDCLLAANNRLQMDYERLEDAGISVKEVYFTFQNSFVGLPAGITNRRPVLRLQDFIHLARVGTPVSVEVVTKNMDIFLTHDDDQRKGIACIAKFIFTTGREKTTIEKLYSIGSFDDPKEYQDEIRNIANNRLERDRERLKRSGIEVNDATF